MANSNLYTPLQTLTAARFHVKHRTLGSQQKVMEQVSGGHHSLRKGSGMTFSEVRQYQAGDDIRHIDWRVTARTQKPHTKVFTEEHEKPVVIVSEQTPAMFFGSQVQLKSEQALNIAALIGWSTLHQNDQIGGLVFNQHQHAWLAPKRQKQSLLSWFHQGLHFQKQLNHPGKQEESTWQQACQQLSKVVKPGSKLFLMGDLLMLNETTLAHLKKIRRHSEITAIHIYDPLEKQLPKLGLLNLTSGWNSGNLIPINSMKRKARQQYQQHYQNALEKSSQKLRQIRIPLIEIGTHQNALDELLLHRILQ